MAATKPLDIVARFRTVTTDFNTREVERELDQADDAFRDSERASQRWSRTLRTSADDAADGVRRGTRFKEAGKEIGSEFSQNIGEGFRSGDLRGSVLETFTSLGPALGVAGLALGAGAAIVNGIVNGIEANAQKVRQAVADAYGEAVDEVFGGGGTRTIADIIGALSPEDITNIKKTGYTVGQFAQAVADAESGDPRKLDAISDALNRRAEALDEMARSGGARSAIAGVKVAEQLAGTRETVALIDAQTDAIRRRRDALSDLNSVAGNIDLERLRAVGGAVNAIVRDPDFNRGRR